MSWHNKKFIDFILLQRGHDLTKEQIIPGIYPVVTSTSIMGYHNTYKANGPGVVTGRSGTIGEVQYITENYWPHNTSLYVKDFKGNHPKFVYYFMKNFGTGRAKSGSAVPTLNKNNLSGIDVKVPDYEIQVRIADILSSYDDLIENNQKQITLLEEAAQRLYKEWFVDLHFPGYEDVKNIEGVPEGWTYRKVEEFGEVITGKTPSTSKMEYYGGSIPFVTIPDMHGNVFPLVTEKTLTKTGADTQKNKYIPTNSIIVSCIATVGLVNIAVKSCQTNQQINSVILHDDNDLYFFYESMKRIKALLDGVGSNGATMTNVNKTKFSNIKVMYPTEDLVMKYNEFCKLIFAQILALSKSNLISKQTRDYLLPKLMSGEIEV
mgnify:FL=1